MLFPRGTPNNLDYHQQYVITAGPTDSHNLMGITFPPYPHLLILDNFLYPMGHVFNITAPFHISVPFSQSKMEEWRALTWRPPRNNLIVSPYGSGFLYVSRRVIPYTITLNAHDHRQEEGQHYEVSQGSWRVSLLLKRAALIAKPLYGDTWAGGQRVVRGTTNQWHLGLVRPFSQ